MNNNDNIIDVVIIFLNIEMKNSCVNTFTSMSVGF
ncbi:MAG: hypothetical protein QT09_C0009G0001, partial [archaeon GW2011_AR18]